MKETWGLSILLLITALLSAQPTRFSLLPASKTGVDFKNTVIDEKDHNILIYSNYYGGAGVGIGDFNRDGLPDLFFGGNLVGDELYLNQGDFQFKKVTEEAGLVDNGGWSSGVIVADVNSDGWDDVYVTRELYDDQPQLRRNLLYLNQKNGTFKEAAADWGVDDDGRTRHATFLDYDRDGDLDLFLLNQPPNPGNYSPMFGEDLKKQEYAMRLYRNDGGRFSNVSVESGVNLAAFPNSVTASDLNNDGWTDLYVANDYDAPDFLFLNQKDGTFKEVIQSTTRHISFYSMGVDAADINRDGWLDVMVLDMVAEDNFRLKANMSGMNPKSFWNVVERGGHYQYMFNTLQLNQGVDQNGQLIMSDIAQMANVPSTDWSWCNLFADLDNDGWQDLYITNGLLRDIRNTDSSKEFPEYIRKVINDFIKNNPAAGDVSIWDILDLAEAMKLIPSEKLSNYAFKNYGDLSFSKKMNEWGLEQPSFSNGAAYADLDLDGDLDLVVSNINEKAFLYRNNTSDQSSNNNYLRVQLLDSKNSRTLLGSRIALKLGDQTLLQEMTNVRGMYSSSEQIAHFGLGAIKMVDEVIITWPDQQVSSLKNVEAGQVLKLDYQDLKKSNLKEKAPVSTFFEKADLGITYQHKENDFDDFAKQVLLPHRMSTFGPALAKGDINGDGLEDVFLGGATGQVGQCFLQGASGQFTPIQQNAFQADELQEDIDAALFDADQDGDLDLYIVSGGNAFPQQNKMYQDRLYLNDGKGIFTKPEGLLPKFRDSGACVRPHDFDGDGDLDLFVGGRHIPWDYPSPAISRLLRNDGGKFTDITKSAARELIYLGLVTDATWIDYDQDGDTDLAVVGEWMPITIFENEGGKFSKSAPPMDHSEGWWYSIQTADMDQDGDQDLIVGNLGDNYKYKASVVEPFEVHYSDFDANGSKDIVLSYYNFGKQYPLRGRSCSAEQVPELKKKFESYNLFAGATLDKVYGEKNLDKALHYQANTFSSFYLENHGSGKFIAKELAPEAQLSSINAIEVLDVNQDGHQDIVLAGNLYGSEIETTRNDAGIGLVLLGDGKGKFNPLSAKDSGLYLPFDVKQTTYINTAKGTFLLAACNNEALKIYKIRSQKVPQKAKRDNSGKR